MLKNKVLDVIHKYNLIPKKSKLLVGVSGGPDSLVLLHLLKQIQSIFAFDLLVAHVDHMLRGEESYEDYLFVEQICKKWGVAFEGTRVDVPAYMKKMGEAQSLPQERYDMVFLNK